MTEHLARVRSSINLAGLPRGRAAYVDLNDPYMAALLNRNVLVPLSPLPVDPLPDVPVDDVVPDEVQTEAAARGS